MTKRECITHHYACDCREERFAKTESDLLNTRAKIAELEKLNGEAVALLRRYDTVVRIIADAADLDPENYVVHVSANKGHRSRELSRVSLADCLLEVDNWLAVNAPEEPEI